MSGDTWVETLSRQQDERKSLVSGARSGRELKLWEPAEEKWYLKFSVWDLSARRQDEQSAQARAPRDTNTVQLKTQEKDPQVLT